MIIGKAELGGDFGSIGLMINLERARVRALEVSMYKVWRLVCHTHFDTYCDF
jgi:hypothetical protein